MIGRLRNGFEKRFISIDNNTNPSGNPGTIKTRGRSSCPRLSSRTPDTRGAAARRSEAPEAPRASPEPPEPAASSPMIPRCRPASSESPGALQLRAAPRLFRGPRPVVIVFGWLIIGRFVLFGFWFRNSNFLGRKWTEELPSGPFQK